MNQTIAFHTFGCKVNQYETEELRTQLRIGGFSVVPMESPADVYVINSCSVTAGADSSCRQMVRKVLRERPSARIVVTGCYAERAPEELRDLSKRVEVYGNREKPMIAVALGVPTACVQAAANSGVTALADRSRAYLKIQDGCDAKCTYCIIPSVRSELICRPPELLVREMQALVAHGYREIVLTGVRLGRYQWRNVTFTILLRSLLDLPGEFRVRLSSIEVTEIPDAVVGWAADDPKLCPFFHIPLQSGDDSVLKRMGRWYTAVDYRDRIGWIRNRAPDVALSADVIVGFAGEEETHFQKTMQLLDEEGFSRVHAFRYSIRPGTSAERLRGHVDPRVKSERTRRMVRLDADLRRRYAARFLDKAVIVLQESDGSGYSERYVRIRTGSAYREGTLQRVVPRSQAADGSLVV
ncbi:MAG TPA: tRNA (N(6)-L-threonylcarbamoyladenosine(37)-C(2))-methylthiotransferase MtaB [Elusimicrobiota bacterium]|nr:tRNA (N(6)-L-threonylcarbamoyladenosine(37)-C(2))-methylthiotransferase MtaB [Elusimicrobiota bacterium]